MHDEAGGVLRVILFTADDVPDLIVAAAAGDAHALGYIRALDTYRRRIEGSADDAPFCLTCGRRLGAARVLIGLVVPARDDARRCLVIELRAQPFIETVPPPKKR